MAGITTLSLPRHPQLARHAPPPVAAEVKSLPVLSFPAELFFGMQGDQSVDTVRGLNAYAVYALAYACMRYRATKLIEAPLWIAQESEDGEEWLKGDHPLAMLLEQPNPDMEMADLLETVSLYTDAGGRALLLKNRDRAGRVASLYPFSDDEFTVEPSDGRLYGKFRVHTSKGLRDFGPDDVVFFRDIDPRSPTAGLGPLEAALEHVNIGVDMRKAIRANLRNAIRPGAKVETEKTLTDDEFAVFKERLTAGYAGATNQGKTLIIEGGAKLEQLLASLKDLELGPVQGDVEAAICQCFQVHPAIVGARIGLENSSAWSDVIKSATELFYDIYAIPRWGRIERTLTRSLLREVDGNPLRFIRFDKTKVRALQKDLGQRTTEATAASAYWTVNEQRVHTGQKPLEDDERGEQLGRMAVPAGTVPSGKAAPAIGLETKEAPRRLTPQETHRIAEEVVFDTQLSFLELLAAQLLDEDKQALLRIVGALRRELADDPPLQGDEIQAATRQAGDYLQRAQARWREAFTPALESVASTAVERVAAQASVDFNLLQPGIRSFVEREAAFLVTSVTDTTKEAVRQALASGFEAGEGVRKIAKRIQEAGDFGRARAKLIAGTEITRSRNGAARETMSEYQAAYDVKVTKEWVNSNDGKVRPKHRNKPQGVGGERVGVDEAFSNGLQAPSEPGCRCTMFFHTGEDA